MIKVSGEKSKLQQSVLDDTKACMSSLSSVAELRLTYVSKMTKVALHGCQKTVTIF